RISTPSYEIDGGARKTVRDAVNASCSLAQNRLLLTVVNEDLTRDLEFEIELRGARPRSATGLRLWSQNVRDHNTFDQPARIKPASFTPRIRGGEFRVELPAHSASAVEVELA
ncbi:MAG: hypothetical protein L0387_13175, partial [Acidobacteria bacterium]|nr:hypothetical protein [Acidobacteriota bacterium]MCI0723853.1 hypothetical protein [Acidobacteriota bacterium]